MDTNCANCGARVADLYCGSCGQSRAGRLGFRDVGAAVLSEVASFDTAFPRTFAGLALRPGRVAREYIEGRRTLYLNPLKYALLAVTVYVVLAHLFDAQVGPPRQRAAGDTFDTVVGFLPYLMLLALLPAAALQKLLFRSSGDRVVECYVFGLFAYSHVFWLLTPLVLAGIYGVPYGTFVVHGLRLAFWTWATMGFYRSRSLGALLKGPLVLVSVFVVTVICAGSAARLLCWWG